MTATRKRTDAMNIVREESSLQTPPTEPRPRDEQRDEQRNEQREGTPESARRGLRRGGRPGMTLVEIMIVLTIMAGIMAFAAYSVVGYLKSAKVKNAEGEVNQLRGFVNTFLVMHNRLPNSLDELSQPIDGLGQVTDRVPNDPWGNTYEYTKRNDGTFVLFSVGPDGQGGTDDDIYPEGMGGGRL
jgi:general secretion pathway protein G